MITGVEIKGVEVLSAKLKKAAEALGPKSDLPLFLAQAQSTNIKLGVQAGTDLTGGPFQRLALRSGQPLLNTGKMVASVNAAVIGPGMAAVRPGGGLQNLKALVHQFGSGLYNTLFWAGRIYPSGGGLGPIKATAGGYGKVSKSGKIKASKVYFRSVAGVPARPWFGFRPGDGDKISKMAEAWINKQLEVITDK